MKKFLLLFFVIFSLSAGAFAKSFKSVSVAEKFVSSVVDQFSDGNFKEAMDSMKPYCKLSESKIDSLVEQTGLQWSLIENNYGKKIDTELVYSKEAGKSLVMLAHLARFERSPLVFYTILYRTDEGWEIVGFSFKDSVSELFD